MRTDTAGNLKWARWVYDSTNNRATVILQAATVNSVREMSTGNIACAAGKYFTDLNYIYGSLNSNYAGFLVCDSAGKGLRGGGLNNSAGYYVGGFDIEETPSGAYLISGNQAINFVDTSSTTIWQCAYKFMLEKVGLEINNVVRCKKLRNGTFVVAGMAYEGNCWTNFEKLYYDAWWSPISLVDGHHTTWDTAGYQGGNDQINDFTQLRDDNLVFIGKKNINTAEKGIWVFVTSSTSNQIYWEKEISGSLNGAEPYSVCATPDSGFTVVGKKGYNAFAAHFVPKPPVGAAQDTPRRKALGAGYSTRIHGTTLTINHPGAFTASLFDIAGKRVARASGQGEVVIDVSRLIVGSYCVRVTSEAGVWEKKVMVER